VTHPDDLNLNLQMRDEVLAGRRESFTMEKRYLKKNGDIVWTRHSVSATHGVGGAVASFVVVAEDITERKCAEEALRLRQTELQALFDLIPAMVWFKDTHNRVLRVNQRAAEITGRPVTEIEGQSMRELHPLAAAKYYADDLEVIRSGAPKLAIIETLRDPNGRELLVQTDKVPVCGKDGKVSGIIVMAQDITERIKSEEA
jgi:PAS domain S-box-containing protein